MSSPEIVQLCREISYGDLTMCGPLLDLLKDQQDDRRYRFLYDAIGRLSSRFHPWTGGPLDNLRNRYRGLVDFHGTFNQLFWPELFGGSITDALVVLDEHAERTEEEWLSIQDQIHADIAQDPDFVPEEVIGHPPVNENESTTEPTTEPDSAA